MRMRICVCVCVWIVTVSHMNDERYRPSKNRQFACKAEYSKENGKYVFLIYTYTNTHTSFLIAVLSFQLEIIIHIS